MKNIMYLGPGEALPAARAIFEPRWGVVAPDPANKEAVLDSLGDAVGILDASMRVRFDRGTLDRAPGLRVVGTATTGADHIDEKALADRAIPLLTLKGEREVLQELTPAAELSWLLLLACARRLRGATRHVLEGRWIREEFPGIMLKGKALGLVGCGRIGSWMARYAQAFRMKILGYDPFITSWPSLIEKAELEDVLKRSDFLSLHVPLNDHTRGMIGKRELELMKPGAIFINTSRGGLVDENALLMALDSGRLAGAGLDVLNGEPEIDRHPLVEYARTHENLMITPHIGGYSPDAVKIVVEHAARRIASALDGLRE